VAVEEKKEREAALTKARKTLSSMDRKVSQAKGDAQVAREASEKAKEEATQSREEVVLAEEAATKAREEAARYKGAAAELDMEKRLVESDLITARNAYDRIKEELLKNKIARGDVVEAEKKACEDLETERIRSNGLSDDVDRLKRMLREKEEAILQSSKMIEDLWVKNTDLAHSYKEIEWAKTDLVGENTALEEGAPRKFFVPSYFFC